MTWRLGLRSFRFREPPTGRILTQIERLTEPQHSLYSIFNRSHRDRSDWISFWRWDQIPAERLTLLELTLDPAVEDWHNWADDLWLRAQLRRYGVGSRAFETDSVHQRAGHLFWSRVYGQILRETESDALYNQ